MFVLLEHTLPDGIHWDLMVELPGRPLLATWRLAENPLTWRAGVPAERIGDHRQAYLDYEGPVSDGRGEVRRLDRGPCDVLADDHAGSLWLRLAGARLAGVFELRGDRFCPGRLGGLESRNS
jgi:hypothetical protein